MFHVVSDFQSGILMSEIIMLYIKVVVWRVRERRGYVVSIQCCRDCRWSSDLYQVVLVWINAVFFYMYVCPRRWWSRHRVLAIFICVFFPFQKLTLPIWVFSPYNSFVVLVDNTVIVMDTHEMIYLLCIGLVFALLLYLLFRTCWSAKYSRR